MNIDELQIGDWITIEALADVPFSDTIEPGTYQVIGFMVDFESDNHRLANINPYGNTYRGGVTQMVDQFELDQARYATQKEIIAAKLNL